MIVFNRDFQSIFRVRGGLANRSEPDWRLPAIEVNRSYLLQNCS
jgi:hypothetical protein